MVLSQIDLTFEDGEQCSVTISVGMDQDYLRIVLRPPLAKTPVDTLLPKACRYIALLHRTQKHYDWESDFRGSLLRKGHLYQAGIHVCRNHDNREFLTLFLRWEVSRPPGTPGALEVVR